MNLHQLIEQYVAFRRALGERCKTQASVLRAFARAVGSGADISAVRAEQVSAFLAGSGPITLTWHHKHSILLGFYRYAVSRGYVSSTPLPAVVPRRPPPFVPYIYSHEDLRRLLDATDTCRRYRGSVEPVTARMIVLLLYGTGLRVSEALGLDRADVDLENCVLTVRQTKFFKTRLVPIRLELSGVLAQYAGQRPAPPLRPGEAIPFFTARNATCSSTGVLVLSARASEKGLPLIVEKTGNDTSVNGLRVWARGDRTSFAPSMPQSLRPERAALHAKPVIAETNLRGPFPRFHRPIHHFHPRAAASAINSSRRSGHCTLRKRIRACCSIR